MAPRPPAPPIRPSCSAPALPRAAIAPHRPDPAQSRAGSALASAAPPRPAPPARPRPARCDAQGLCRAPRRARAPAVIWRRRVGVAVSVSPRPQVPSTPSPRRWLSRPPAPRRWSVRRRRTTTTAAGCGVRRATPCTAWRVRPLGGPAGGPGRQAGGPGGRTSPKPVGSATAGSARPCAPR